MEFDGFEIKVRRLRIGLKQYQLAYKVGVAPSILSAIENNRQIPTPWLLRRIEEVLSEEEARRRDGAKGVKEVADVRQRGGDQTD